MDITRNAITARTVSRIIPPWLKPLHVLLGAAGLLIIIHGVMWVTVFSQASTEERLKEDIAVARRAIGNSPMTSVAPLEQARADAETQLAAAQAAIPDRIHTTTVTSGLFYLAQTHNVVLASLQSRPAGEQTVGQHRYTLTPFTIAVRGKPDDMVAFLAELQTSPQQTLVTQMSQLGSSKDGSDLRLDVEIYTRAPAKPAPDPTKTANDARHLGKKP